MKANMIIDQKSQKVKLILDWSSGKVGQHLAGDEAEKSRELSNRQRSKPVTKRSWPVDAT